MSYRLNSNDLREVRKEVVDNIYREKNGLIGDVGYEMNHDRKIEDDVIGLVDILTEELYVSLCEEHREDIMRSNRGFTELTEGLTKIIAHVIGYNIDPVYNKMTNTEIDNAKDYLRVIDDVRGGNSRDRDNGRDRDRGRGGDRDNGRRDRRDNRRGGSNRRDNDRDRDRGRDNDRSERRNSSSASSPYSRRVSNNSRNNDRHEEDREEQREPTPIIELAIKSNVIAEPTETSRVAYDTSKLALMHETIDGVVTEVLVEADTVESYDEHELSRRPFAAELYERPDERQGETQYELIPDLSDKDSTEIRVVDGGITFGEGTAPDISKIFHKTLPESNSEVVITNVQHNVLLQYPATLEIAAPATLRTFDAWHNYMVSVHAAIATMESIKDITLAQSFLSRLDVMLTDQFNRLLAVSVSVNTSVSSFYRYFKDAKAFIDSPENGLIQGMYREIERNILGHSFKAMSYRESKLGKEDLVADDTIKTVVIEMPFTYIKVFGVLAQNRVHLANDGAFVRVTHDNTPEFTEVARSGIRRVKGKSNVVLGDVFGNSVEVVSAGSAASPIAARLK